MAVAVWAICAESEQEARTLAASGQMTLTLLRRGRLIAVPPPQDAVRFLAAEAQRGSEASARRRALVGTPQMVAQELREVVASYGAQEAIVVCITYSHAARLRSYELLADALAQ